MKKTALFISVLCTLYFALYTNVSAQTFDANKAYQDYQYSLDVYNQSNKTFIEAKNFYLTNKTLTLKEDARKKLLTMLRNRDRLEWVYLTALRMKIVENKGLTNDEKGGIYTKIDNEVAWYKSHIDNYKDGDPAEDLFNKSAESQTRLKTNSSPIVYESLFMISLGEEINLRQEHDSIFNNLKSIIEKGVNDGKLDMNPFNRWFTDIGLVVDQLKQNEDLSRTQIQKLYNQYNSNSGAYNTAIETLISSIKPLSQLNRFLIEVLTSIKNQQ
jgi:hypothetical protein